MTVVNSVPGRRVYFISGYFYILEMKFNGHMVMELIVHMPGVPERPGLCRLKDHLLYQGQQHTGRILHKAGGFSLSQESGRANRPLRKRWLTGAAIAVHDDPKGAYAKLAACGEVSPAELKEFAAMFL